MSVFGHNARLAEDIPANGAPRLMVQGIIYPSHRGVHPLKLLTPPTLFATGGKSSYTYPDKVSAILNYMARRTLQ